jgi:hypothetical protein
MGLEANVSKGLVVHLDCSGDLGSCDPDGSSGSGGSIGWTGTMNGTPVRNK